MSSSIDLGLGGARAVVVGAGFLPDRAGHGRGSALRLAAAGATVACVDMDASRADAIVDEITSAGGSAFPVIGDMTDSAQADAAVAEAVGRLGGIDVCVDIIGRALWGTSSAFSDQLWDTTILENLTQVFYVFRATVPHMIDQGTGGSIVAISSLDGIGSSKYHAAYGAAKAGVISLVKSYSDEFGEHGIRVNAVAPGNVGGGNWDAPDTPFGQDPINSLAPPRPHDIADTVLYLSSRLAARVTGQTIVVDGGASTRSPWGFREDQIESLNESLVGVGQVTDTQSPS